MKVFAVDDEQYMLKALCKAIRAAVPNADVHAFRTASDVLAAQSLASCHVAFLDIQLPECSGVDLASRLIDMNPFTNIVFVTGHDQYKADAMDVHASDYLLKPVTEEKVLTSLQNLRHPVSKSRTRFRAVTFGNFALYVDGVPVVFHRKKSAELLAYLIDCGGTTVSRPELTMVLFDDDSHSRASQKKLNNALLTLEHDLEEVGAEEILCRKSDGIAVNRQLLSADCFDFLERGMPRFCGRYMDQYSWGEVFKAANS